MLKHAKPLSWGIEKPLARAIALLGPHTKAIESSWRTQIHRLARSHDQREALEALSLKGHYSALRAGRLSAYHLALERLGQSLSTRGVPEEDAFLALSFYLESCLPFLLRPEPKAREAAMAVVRVVARGQLSLLSGYTHRRTSGWRALDERERLRLSRDLHDEIGHNLLVLKLYLEMISRDLLRQEAGNVALKLAEASTLVGQSIASVRRLILDLGPAILDEVGFMAAVKLYAKQFSGRTGIKVSVREAPLPKLPSSYETALYRVVQGALSNVVKHADSKTVRVTLGSAGKSVIVMIVEDDGVGFDTTPSALEGFGLAAMRDRIETLGGRFHVESSAPSGGRTRGTRIEVDLPLRGGDSE
jgi:signal transduction histidine kinase